MGEVRVFFVRSGQAMWVDVSPEVRDRLRVAHAFFGLLTREVLIRICVDEGVALGVAPREEELVRWLEKNGF